jgi:DNA-binding transcriptional LysR family regulator
MFARKSAGLTQPENGGSFASQRRSEVASPIGMELRLLRRFLAVAEERSVAKAAKRLLVSQAILSRQIRKLEAELKVQLLVRHRGSVELTNGGNTLSANSRNLLSLLAETIHSVRTAAA